MPNETTAQRLARLVAVHLQTLQNWGATFNQQYLTGTRISVSFPDGEIVTISFSTKGAKGK